MLNFYDIDILVDGQPILADSASINSENSLQTFKIIGANSPFIAPAGSIRNSAQLAYNLKIGSDPIVDLLPSIKNGTYNAIEIEIAGLVVTGYLDSFSIRAIPHQPTKATVNFTSFNPIGGIFSEKSYSINQDFSSDMLSHGWTTYISSSGTYLTIPTYEFSYDLTVNWQPIYTIGRKFPSQVHFAGGEERITLLRDEYYEASFSGVDHGKRLLGSNTERQIELTALTFLWNSNIQSKLEFNLSLGKINTSNVEARVDDFVKTRVGIINSF